MNGTQKITKALEANELVEKSFHISKFSLHGDKQTWNIEEFGRPARSLDTTIAGSLAIVEAMAEEAEADREEWEAAQKEAEEWKKIYFSPEEEEEEEEYLGCR